MGIKVSELERDELDYWVARAEGIEHPPHLCEMRPGRVFVPRETESDNLVADQPYWVAYQPSQDWATAGPIIARELGTFSIERNGDGAACWYWADMGRTLSRYRLGGPDHLIAAMRAYVASKFGEEVPSE